MQTGGVARSSLDHRLMADMPSAWRAALQYSMTPFLPVMSGLFRFILYEQLIEVSAA
jgi:hypothetical protein